VDRDQREPLYRFAANGREYHSGTRAGGPAEACAIAREGARKLPDVEHTVHDRNGKLLASYKLVAGKMQVRMP
jgi:hypothetical protein